MKWQNVVMTSGANPVGGGIRNDMQVPVGSMRSTRSGVTVRLMARSSAGLVDVISAVQPSRSGKKACPRRTRRGASVRRS